MFRREIVVGIAEQSPGRFCHLRIVVAQAKREGAVGWNGHCVHVTIIGEAGMTVIVERGDLTDLPQQSLVDGLHIRSQERARLSLGGRGAGCRPRDGHASEPKQRPLTLFHQEHLSNFNRDLSCSYRSPPPKRNTSPPAESNGACPRLWRSEERRVGKEC